MAIPQYEKVFTLARIEGLPHLLDARLFVGNEGLLERILGFLLHFVLKLVCRPFEPILVQIFKNGAINILL